MDKINQDSQKNKESDKKGEKRATNSDEQLLKEFEKAHGDNAQLPLYAPPSDEFDIIWNRIQKEHATKIIKVLKVRFRCKRLVALGVIVGVLTCSGGLLSWGRKAYFFNDGRKPLIEKNIVFDNDSGNKAEVGEEEEAYDVISKNMGFKPLKLGYRPDKMYFDSLQCGEEYANVVFQYEGRRAFFVQSKFNAKSSYSYQTDSRVQEKIYNKWLHMDVEISVEKVEGGTRCEALITKNGIYYRITGLMDKTDFQRLVEEIHY